MRIIRFLDDENREHYGLESQDKTAEILQGELYEGLSPSGATASIAKLLAPVDPVNIYCICLLYTSPSPRDRPVSRMPSSA